MTNSDGKPKPAQILKEIFQRTNEEYLKLRIDEPVERAAASFTFDRDAPVTHQTFTQVTSDFVRHIYERGLRCREEMSATETCGEAVAILEEGYQTSYGQGYYGAFLDASNAHLNGLDYVLVQMASLMVMKAKARYIRWVCASKMELADWPTRCVIADILHKRWESFLLPNVRVCPPEQLASHLSELISVVLSTNWTVAKMLGANADL